MRSTPTSLRSGLPSWKARPVQLSYTTFRHSDLSVPDQAVNAGHPVGADVTEYRRIVEENRLDKAYGALMALLETIAKQRSVDCRPDEFSRACPQSFVIGNYYQDGRTSSGTAPLRSFTIAGSDGQIMNIQGFDLTSTVTFFVRHGDGSSQFEKIDPSEAIKRLGWEAGYHLPGEK